MDLSPKHRVLVVCHGNINRSAACEAALRGHVSYPRSHPVEIRSAGFREAGKRAARKTREFMLGHGYSLDAHRSRKITSEDLAWATKIVYMDGGNLKRLLELGGEEIRPKLVALGSLKGHSRIADPGFMAKGSREYAETMQLVLECSRELAKELSTR